MKLSELTKRLTEIFELHGEAKIIVFDSNHNFNMDIFQIDTRFDLEKQEVTLNSEIIID